MFLLQKNELFLLRNMPPDNEKVIESILRKYGGVFSDYIYIDEKDIAARTNLSQNTVYNILKALGQQHIAHYIPRKNTPYITFKTRRVDTHEIVLTPEIYEEEAEYFLIILERKISTIAVNATSATQGIKTKTCTNVLNKRLPP